ncbi:hypothetical protein HA402_004145 [Bradysia odoriphaga]|nr:hypothetical protein HA402_004145 [Bradysia odoriphaga]
MIGNSRNPYHVLETMPKFSVFYFYCGSLIVGLWHVVKLILYFSWNWIMQMRLQSGDKNMLETDDGYHDKPPKCLVDNTLGRQLYVKLKEVKFHYIEAGDQSNPLALLLHGFPDCWLGWNSQISELSKFFRVVAVDLKGFNDSDKPPKRHSYQPQLICEELSQFIKCLGYNSCTVIGHDLGGLIGWIFAHTNPDKVDRFVTISSPHPNIIWKNLHPQSQVNDIWLKFVQIPVLPENQFSDSDFLEKCLPHVYSVGRTKKHSKDMVDRCLTNAYKYVFNRTVDWTGPLNYYRNFPFYKIREGETLRCPTLIITGSDDVFCKLDSIVRSAEYCDKFTLKIIDGCKHWPHQEMPEQFNKVLMKFLVGNRARHDLIPEPSDSPKGIIGMMGISRMFGAVSNTVKNGFDTMQQRTSDVLHGTMQK